MNVKEKGNDVVSGFLWKLAEMISAQAVSFVVSLILARILAPEHYGTVAVVNIFIAFANIFVSSGLGNSLIQKKDADEIDFSSVFYANIFISVVLYAILFFAAPFIAELYDTEILTPVLRVMGLNLILSGLNNVQQAYVSKKMIFKRFFFATIIGTAVSAVVGIVMACLGYGVWALVAQYLINKAVDSAVLLLTVRWRPKLLFSISRLKGLFSYGWKLLVSEIINTGYVELRGLVIGIKYTAMDLAYYNKGQSFPKLLSVNINASLSNVLFPKLSNVQDRIDVVKDLVRKSIKISGYVVRPVVIGLALTAKPVVSLILTEKWLPCVPYLQIYCLFYLFHPIQAASLQVIKSLGRSDIYLRLEIIKKAIGIVVLIITMPFGTFAIAVGAVCVSILEVLINMIPTKRLLRYGYREQFWDYTHGLLPLALMIAVCVAVSFAPFGELYILIIQVIAGAVVYIGASAIMKSEAFVYLLGFVKRVLKRDSVRSGEDN